MNEGSDGAVTTESGETELHELVSREDAKACRAWLEAAAPGDVVYSVAGLPDGARAALLAMLPPEEAAVVLGKLPESHAVDAIEAMDAPVAASIVEELASDERADLIKALDTDDAEAILTAVDMPVAEDIRRLASFTEGTAGSLMVSEYLVYPDSASVRDVLVDLESQAEAYASYNIQYLYVADDDGALRGVVPIRRLLLAKRSAPISAPMIEDPVSVRTDTPLDDLRALFERYGFLGIPVVTESGVLVGVVEGADVARAEADESDALYRQSQGIVGGEELRSMPLLLRSRRRLAWLSTNIVLNIIAASMIAIHQDTLEAVIAIAVFLPIISDMSGCSGNQAVAVSMRELMLGVTRPRDALRVLGKEVAVGLINGATLGLLIGTIAFAWKGSIYLSLVVGASLAMNTIVAVAIGGLVPLGLKRLKVDPALASGPILTTITDLCGFFIVLTLASQMLNQLTAG